MRLAEPLLQVEALEAFYGDARALQDVGFTLERGETLALIGANGAGKSTLLKSICGLLASKRGRIAFAGREIAGMSAAKIVKLGVALVPEGRRLFPSLSVEENLTLGGQVGRKGPWSLEALYDLFPILKDKRRQPSTSLSGGQQQIVAIGRTLMSNPDLLMLDELSLGLAPVVIKDIYELLPCITARGLTAILVEQDVSRALASANRFLCLQEGRVALAGLPHEHSREAITRAYFGS
jgi:branched-chain amino acid transport system ATP-binding protein